VPLWIATGSGAASRRILGTVVIVGMLAATGIAIFLIPVLFVVVERVASRGKAKATVPAPEPAAPAPGAH
jgi:HAE1 family hydrophobic/amphiphilic exporter-1